MGHVVSARFDVDVDGDVVGSRQAPHISDVADIRTRDPVQKIPVALRLRVGTQKHVPVVIESSFKIQQLKLDCLIPLPPFFLNELSV